MAKAVFGEIEALPAKLYVSFQRYYRLTQILELSLVFFKQSQNESGRLPGPDTRKFLHQFNYPFKSGIHLAEYSVV
jgi:hypothetical protein